MTLNLTSLAHRSFTVFDDETYPNYRILPKRAQEVPLPLSAEHKAIAQALQKRMIDQKGCIGLAAPLLDLPWRVIVMQVTSEMKTSRMDIATLIAPTILINPSFEPLDDVQQADWEASVSIKNQMGKIRRYYNIRYRGWDINNQLVIGEAKGLLARVIQHEIDYLDGRLFTDLFEDDLPYGSINEMNKIRVQELENYHKMNLLNSPYVAIDDETCSNRHILRDCAQNVSLPLSAEHKAIAQALQDRMINQERCVGLAAPQVGVPLRIISVCVAEKLKTYRTDVDTLTEPITLINPSYEPINDERQSNWEGCFSVKNQMGKIRRYHNIRYQGWGVDGLFITQEASGLLARVIQHEIDHLNGILITDLFESDLVHGPLEEMMALRSQEFNNTRK